jgi:predicted ATP-grasp superfamily ATP-dependent carboligase
MARHSYSAPPETDSRAFVERLIQVAKGNLGQILLPTSDETAWLYTEYSAKLEQYFSLYQPSMTSIIRILDKKLLADAAISAGIAVLPSWAPEDSSELAALAPILPYPIVIKPRTHIQRVRNDKGLVVSTASNLVGEYNRFVAREHTHVPCNPVVSRARLPILQQFAPVGSGGVLSVTGFIDRTGELFVARGSTKVFQRLSPLGVGICFESAPHDPQLSEAVRRLCRHLGHFGIFEVEFIRFNGNWALLDFNPRFFNQMGIDIRRGVPLPLMACLDAVGETEALKATVAMAKNARENENPVFLDSFTLRAVILAQVLTGQITSVDYNRWRAWQKRHAHDAVDFVRDDQDRMPTVIHALSEIMLGIRAIPRFLRQPRV